MKKHSNTIIIVIAVIIAGLFGVYKFASLFAPGSYPDAETYELSASEADVINTINIFKADHPELTPPKVQIQNAGQYDLSDGRKDSSAFWYNIYFYYPKENQLIQTWLRPAGTQKTTFAFVSINNGLNIGNWKRVNEDFSSIDNKKIKQQFEERILDSIKQRLQIRK